MINLVDASLSFPPCTHFDFRTILSEISSEYGFRTCSCLHHSKTGDYLMTDLSESMNARYISWRSNNDDPFINALFHTSVPFDWSQAKHSSQMIYFCASSRFFSIQDNAMSFPIHHPDALTIFTIVADKTDGEWERFISGALPELTLTAIRLANFARKSLDEKYSLQNKCHLPTLTRNETDALKTFIRYPETSNPNSPTRLTINTDLKSAKYKLDAVTYRHACAKAIFLGIIEKEEYETNLYAVDSKNN